MFLCHVNFHYYYYDDDMKGARNHSKFGKENQWTTMSIVNPLPLINFICQCWEMAVASVSRPCVAALLLKLFGSIGTTCTYCAVEFRLTKVCSSKSNYEEQVNLWKVLDTSIIYLGGTVVKCYASWKFRATCYWLMFITYCLTPAECSSKIKVETKISHDRRQADTHALSVDDAPSICSLSYPFPDELLTVRNMRLVFQRGQRPQYIVHVHVWNM
jgi:hypothetical protein